MKIKKLFFKRKIYKMDMISANDTLQNVFAACEKEPNTIPFDKLVLRQKADTCSTCICKYATIIMILLLIFIPIFCLQTNANIETETGTSNIQIIDHFVTNDLIHLTLNKGTYYFPSCYALDTNGTRYTPITDLENSNHLIFEYTGVPLHLYICDTYGEYLHLIITPNK